MNGIGIGIGSGAMAGLGASLGRMLEADKQEVKAPAVVQPSQPAKTQERATSGYDTKGQVKKFLISGIEPALIARTLGIDRSYISQLLDDAEFFAEVEAGRMATLQKGAELDAKYDELEFTALTKLQNSMQFMTKPMEIAKVLQIANTAKRRTAVDTSQQKALQQVNITIPQVMLQQVITNTSGEVVRVGDTSLVTMPSSTFKRLAEGKENENQVTDQLQLSPPPEGG